MSTVLPRRLHIRTKVAAALTAPLLAAFAMAVLKAAEVRSAAERVTDESSMATSIVGPGTLLTALQVERNVVAPGPGWSDRGHRRAPHRVRGAGQLPG